MKEPVLLREPALWGVALGLAAALGGGIWAALGQDAPAGWLAAAGAAVALGSLLAVMRTLAHWCEAAAVGVFARILLDAEDGPRLLTDPRGALRYANAPARRLWRNTPPLDWLGAHLQDDPLARETLDRLAEAARAGLREEVDLPLRDPFSPTGEPEWLRVQVAPAGDRALRLWSARDLTARRAIDEVLLREREELADFLFFLPVGLYSVDSDGRLRYVNQVLAQWLGRDPEALIGAPLTAFMDGPAPEPDGAWTGRLRFVPADDPPFEAEVRQATFDDAGQLRTRSVVSRLPEIPERVADGEGGWDRRRPWLFDGAPVGIVLTDPEGALTDCNDSFLAMVGMDRDQVLDQPLARFALRDEQDDLAAHLARVAAGEIARAQIDARLMRGDKEVAVALFLSPMTNGPPAAGVGAAAGLGTASVRGEALPDGVVAHLIDTTDQKNLEQQFAQAQKMQAMGQLAGGVAHDFNNLLTAMIGFSDLLLQRHGIGDPSFADIMQIKQNANRAANLVRQLLAFSRRQPLRPRLLNVTDALAELSHLLRRLLGEQVRLRLIHEREPGYIRVDPGQFDQVIINLAVNARDAMPNGGTLTITTRHEAVETERRQGTETIPPGDYVVIDVADTGTGISRDNLGRLFEPFFTTKSEGTAGAGTGLGLSTVYGIIRQTEGFISVDSTLGEGATFTICLPRHSGIGLPGSGTSGSGGGGGSGLGLPGPAAGSAASGEGADTADTPALPAAGGSLRSVTPGSGDPAALSAAPEAQSAASGAGDGRSRSSRPSAPQGAEEDEPLDLSGKETILLVEDEDAVRVFGARALRNKGYTVLEARTGEGALDLLEDGAAIDLLITDMVMPGMDGATLAGRVRARMPGLPIILISGYSEDAIQGDVFQQPDTHFLPKPFSLRALAEKVREVLTA